MEKYQWENQGWCWEYENDYTILKLVRNKSKTGWYIQLFEERYPGKDPVFFYGDIEEAKTHAEWLFWENVRSEYEKASIKARRLEAILKSKP